MAFDLNQFRAVYFAEVDEHLSAIAACLARMAAAGPDVEVAAEAYRHAHSIKGASATFGHGDVSALAGVLANVFDAVVNRGLVLDARALAGCRTAMERLGALLADSRGDLGGTAAVEAVPDEALGGGQVAEAEGSGEAELETLTRGLESTVAEIRELVARMESLNLEQGAIAARVEHLLQRFGDEMDALAERPALGRLAALDEDHHDGGVVLRRRRKGTPLPKVRAGCRGGLADEWEEH